MVISHRKFFLLNVCLLPGMLGFFCSAGLAWLLYQHMAEIPLWGIVSIATDALLSAFVIPFTLCFVVTFFVKRLVYMGRLHALKNADQLDFHLPLPIRSVFLRAVLIGFIGVLCAAAPVLILWEIFWPEQIDVTLFVWLKAGFSAVFIASLTCLTAWWVLIDASQQLLNYQRGHALDG